MGLGKGNYSAKVKPELGGGKGPAGDSHEKKTGLRNSNHLQFRQKLLKKILET
jgi:hypothetical protein